MADGEDESRGEFEAVYGFSRRGLLQSGAALSAVSMLGGVASTAIAGSRGGSAARSAAPRVLDPGGLVCAHLGS